MYFSCKIKGLCFENMKKKLFLLFVMPFLWACQETASQNVADKKQLPSAEKVAPPPPQIHMDTIKPLFKTIPLAPLKTNLADLQARLEAGKATKIVCYGNSITNGYKTGSFGKVANPYPETLAKLLSAKYPKVSITIKNEGHNGWRSNQALQMVTTLVLPEKPDWVILELGINDAYSSFSPTVFVNYMQKLVQTLKQNNIKVLLMSATPIATPYHEKVLVYHAPLRAMAETEGCAFLDLSTYVAQRADSEKLTTEQLLPDDIHFADDKYSWIAEAIMDLLK
jgi:lysophospholipase L1-like esterase